MAPLKAGIVTLSTNKALEMAEAERAQLLNSSRASRSLQRNYRLAQRHRSIQGVDRRHCQRATPGGLLLAPP
jgi:hypothetical protein